MAENNLNPKQKSTIREYAEAILIALLLALFIRTFVVQAFKIPSGSMKDTLLIGDYIMVNRFLYAPTSFDWENKIYFGASESRKDGQAAGY